MKDIALWKIIQGIPVGMSMFHMKDHYILSIEMHIESICEGDDRPGCFRGRFLRLRKIKSSLSIYKRLTVRRARTLS